MGLMLYIIFSAVYIMVIHFAVAIKNQFNLMLMSGIFVFGGVIGWSLQSYDMGFTGAVILSLIFW